MAHSHFLQVKQGRQNLPADPSRFSLPHRAIIDDAIVKFPIWAVLHEDVDFAIFLDDLVDLGYVLVQKSLLQQDLSLHWLHLLCEVLVYLHYFDRHRFSSRLVDCPLDSREPSFPNAFIYVKDLIHSS